MIGDKIYSEWYDVYRAEDIRQNPLRPVLIKIPGSKGKIYSNYLQRSTEAFRFAHSTVLPLISVVPAHTNDGKIMLVYPWMEHGTLADVLRSERGGGTIPVGWGPTKKSIAVFGTAVAMACIHAAGDCLWDLRPHRIFLNEVWNQSLMATRSL